ncbi:MAG: maleylpyruvate isomerase N-terminal domain-containing protein [Segniliparus sp.]|uniref:maleylpyruvate isomerase N-terminal domain-containing protein n=1 Tax=Segniliparus sp. TaxID=2804064 RepID=UPI003F2ABEFB
MTSTAPLISAEQSLRLLAEQGGLLAATPESALGEPVPAVPGWTAEDVVRHTAKVHRWAALVLRSGPQADLGGLVQAVASSPKGPAAIADYRTSLDQLLAEFGRHDFAEAAATFVGPGDVGWWARRQAHEVLVHRHDAQSASVPNPDLVEPLVAADGVDEWAVVFVPRVAIRDKKPVPDLLSGKRVAIEATDVPGARWVVRTDGNLVGERSDGPADAAVALPAWELLLTVWRRKPLEAAAVTGDSLVARGLYDHIRI